MDDEDIGTTATPGRGNGDGQGEGEDPVAAPPDAETAVTAKTVVPETDVTEMDDVDTKDLGGGDGVKEVGRKKGEAGQGNGARRQAAIRRYWPLAVVGASTVVLAGGIFIALNASDDEPAAPRADQPAAPLGPVEAFRDTQAGFTLSYPKAWQRVPVPEQAPDLRLVLSVGGGGGGSGNAPAGGEDGMWVRAFPPDQIDQKISEFDAEIKAIAQDKPCGTQGSACLRQEQVTIAGANGVRYVYSTPDEASGQESVHVQYFLRRGAGNLYVLVFQAIPAGDLDRLAPAFDQVLSSFQITEQTSPQPTTSTTAKP